MLNLFTLFFTKFLMAETNQTTNNSSEVSIQTASSHEYLLVSINGQAVVDQNISKIKWHENINVVSSSQFNAAQENLCFEIRTTLIEKFPDVRCELINSILRKGRKMTMDYRVYFQQEVFYLPHEILYGVKQQYDTLIRESTERLDSVGLSISSTVEENYGNADIGSCIFTGGMEICGPTSSAEIQLLKYFFVIFDLVWMLL